MKKNLIRAATAAIGLGAIVSGVAACGVDSNPSFTLSGFPNIKLEEAGCTYDPEVQRFGGLFDAQVAAKTGSSYMVFLQLDNNLPSNEDESSNRLNTNKIRLTEIEVGIPNKGDWSFLPAKQRLPVGAVIDTAESAYVFVGALDTGFAKLALEGKDGVPSPIADPKSSSELLLTFRAKGLLGDGTEVESNELTYNLSLCNGCVSACPGNIGAACGLAQPDGFECAEETAQ